MDYNPITGEFTADGNTIGCKHSKGYVYLNYKGEKILAHRKAFELMTGSIPDNIDHIDRNKSNNKWSNLRASTNQLNHMNMPKQKNNKSGVTGVHTLPNGNHVAYIKYKGKRENLGTHKNFNDAVKARRKKEVEYGFTTE